MGILGALLVWHGLFLWTIAQIHTYDTVQSSSVENLALLAAYTCMIGRTAV